MSKSVDNSQDYLDVRDLIERFEELDSELEDACTGQSETNVYDLEWLQATAEDNSHTMQDAVTELFTLKQLLEELKGSGGDHQWLGDWYPVTLIRDSYFVDAMQELCEDCGYIPKDVPGFLAIDWEKTAENLQVDYSSVDYDGVTYWYR